MDAEKLDKARHSLAHLLAMAAKEKDSKVKLAIGPTIETGFYYDFEFSDGVNISQEDIGIFEARMKEFISEELSFEGREVSVDEAREIFKDQPYKLELIDELEKNKETITIYYTGPGSMPSASNLQATSYKLQSGFIDLCRGGHVENTREIDSESFALTHTAGAYWRGDEKNKMLTRIYGLAFENKEALQNHQVMLEEAKKHDHRKIAKDLQLFMVSEDIGKGLPLWLPNGAFIRKKLEDYMYEKEFRNGYEFVYTPVLTHKKLYETSGHLAHYKDDMYSPIIIENEEYYLKPMNCPHHHMIYKDSPKSYRDLPLRLAEFGLVHRFERSGVLTGLIRARCFTQNDSHIYTRKNKLKEELINVFNLFQEVYQDFGIKDYWYRLSLPDFSNKEKYGDIEDKTMWDESSAIAREVLEELKVKYVDGKGEASFYGPKIDVQIRNVNGKEDTIATLQIDFYSPKRFNLHFTNEKSEDEYPVIIHRAIMGSFERFFAFLIEQTAGNFPLWLAPTQVVVLPIGEKHHEYAKDMFDLLREAGVRTKLDTSNESLGKKIRAAKTGKIPYFLVIGDKEVESNTVTVESRDKGQIGVKSINEFLESLRQEIADKK